MKAGESLTVGGYELKLTAIENVRGPNFVKRTARFEVSRDGAALGIMEAGKRNYAARPWEPPRRRG